MSSGARSRQPDSLVFEQQHLQNVVSLVSNFPRLINMINGFFSEADGNAALHGFLHLFNFSSLIQRKSFPSPSVMAEALPEGERVKGFPNEPF